MMPSALLRGRTAGWTLVGALAVAVLIAGTVQWLRMPDGGPAPAPPPAPAAAPAQRSSALFAGDGFTMGSAGTGRNSYPDILARSAGWNCNIDADRSAGFVEPGTALPGERSARLIDRLDTDKGLYVVDLLIIDAGRNDLNQPPRIIADAVAAYIAKARQLWPTATMAMIMPSYLMAQPFNNYGELKSLIVPIAASARVTLLDPVSERWYADTDLSTLTASDGTYPNALGNQTIADRLRKSMVDHGLERLLGSG